MITRSGVAVQSDLGPKMVPYSTPNPRVLEPAPRGLVSAEVVKQSHHSFHLTKNASQPCAIPDWRVPTLSGPCACPP